MRYGAPKLKRNYIKFYLIGCILIIIGLFSAVADSAELIPLPRLIEFKNGEVFLSNKWSIVLDESNEKSLFVGKYLLRQINVRCGIILKLEDVNSPHQKTNCIILDKIDGQKSKDFITGKNKIYFSSIGDEGYLLDISPNSINILGNTSRGIFYGTQTFIQLLGGNKEKDGVVAVTAVKIIDYPKVKMRAVHFSGVNPDKIKEQLDKISQLKYNTAIIETPSYFSLSRSESRSRMEEIFRYARERFIEPIPELQSFGASGPVLRKDPFAVEGIRIENEPYKFINNLATPLIPTSHSLVNLIIDGADQVIIQSSDEKNLYAEGKDYKIVEGPVSYPFKLNNMPSQIMKTADSAIKDNEEVLISYTYFENKASYKNADCTIPYCPSSERTYKIMFDSIKNVIEVLKPNYLSVGHDEIRGINRDKRCRERGLSNAEILADDISKLYYFSKTIDPHVKMLIWSDMLNPYDNGGNANFQLQYGGLPGVTAPAIDLIPKDIIIMLWRYDPDRNFLMKSADYFETKQFEYFVAGWNNKQNLLEWSQIAKKRINCLGIIVTTWYDWEGNFDIIKYTAEISWH
ncbi:MAG: glycoside hydrolase family 20 zincin-like fold domain-containing protein [Candidatus Omnitrophota bacterium]